jgi:hypothetical protein
MKKTRILLLAQLPVLGLLAIAAGDRLGFAPSFGDSTGTNTWEWVDPGLAVKISYGTNVYTGITSNRVFLGGTPPVTNTLVIRNGIIVGIQ